MRCVVGLQLLVLVASAQAWGRDGHRLIADLAMERLGPAAHTEVQRLLALEPGATLASVSTWPDEVRSPDTAAWHYVNFRQGEGCRYTESVCQGGACVVAAIERQAAVLASNAPDLERLKALKYLVHFVADAHQPLHAGLFEDRGGNGHQVQAFGRGTNLHAVWDAGLVERWPGGLQALAMQARGAMHPAPGLEAAGWVEASCQIVATPSFYPEDHRIGADYAGRWAPTVVGQLGRAGARLAALLNRILGGR